MSVTISAKPESAKRVRYEELKAQDAKVKLADRKELHGIHRRAILEEKF